METETALLWKEDKAYRLKAIRELEQKYNLRLSGTEFHELVD